MLETEPEVKIFTRSDVYALIMNGTFALNSMLYYCYEVFDIPNYAFLFFIPIAIISIPVFPLYSLIIFCREKSKPYFIQLFIHTFISLLNVTAFIAIS